MSISSPGGSPTAGQTYSLTCSVQVVPHLVVEPSIEWTRQDGTVLNASSGSRLQLNFNPVMTSDGGRYTCRASVNIIGLVFASAEHSRDLILTPDLLQCSLNNNELYVHIVCESIPHTSTSCSFDEGPTHKCERIMCRNTLCLEIKMLFYIVNYPAVSSMLIFLSFIMLHSTKLIHFGHCTCIQVTYH